MVAMPNRVAHDWRDEWDAHHQLSSNQMVASFFVLVIVLAPAWFHVAILWSRRRRRPSRLLGTARSEKTQRSRKHHKKEQGDGTIFQMNESLKLLSGISLKGWSAIHSVLLGRQLPYDVFHVKTLVRRSGLVTACMYLLRRRV